MTRLGLLVVALTFLPAWSARAQSAASADVDEVPVSLERIRRELRHAEAALTDDGRLRYYVEVYGRAPRLAIQQHFDGFDLQHGPVPFAGVTHQEFLDFVTPPEYRSFAAFSGTEALQVAATTYLTRWIAERLGKTRDNEDRGGRDGR
jgi:hypothetical protein